MSKRRGGLASAIGTFTSTHGGYSKKAIERWFAWWESDARALRNLRKAKEKAWDELWKALNNAFFCPLCGEKVEFDGRAWRSWMNFARCPACVESGMTSKTAEKKFCRYCRTEIHRAEFINRPHGKHGQAVEHPGKGWGRMCTCANCQSLIKELKELCDEEIKRIFEKEPNSSTPHELQKE